MGTDKLKMNYWKIFLILVGVTIVFWAGVAAVSKWLDFVITDTNVVLTFVGVLATFVVISNYAQVQEIKYNTEKQVNMLQEEIKEIKKELEKKVTAYLKVDKDSITIPADGSPAPVEVVSNTDWKVE